MVTGKITNFMVKVILFGQTDQNIVVNIIWIKNKVLGSLFGQTVGNTKEDG